MKDVILRNWHFLRVLRLLIGLAVVVQAILQHDALFAFAGSALSLLAIFNTSCCGAGSCNTVAPGKKADTSDIEFEEIK